MAEPTNPDRSPVTLAERFDSYKSEVEQIVVRGIEHPSYELKRCATVSRDNLADRLDFVKLIQGLANAHLNSERFIVVGADQRERRFVDVTNADEFDPATLSQIISKYLAPPPRVEVFNRIRAEGGESYVLIVINPDQPCPIVAVTEGQSKERVHFRVGDIWIKENTSLRLATRTDLDAMYERHMKARVEEEAENRARRRFDHFREEFAPALAKESSTAIPRPALLVGPRKDLRSFAESTICTGDILRLRMLLEMARDQLVEEWGSHQVNGPGLPEDPGAWAVEIREFYRDGFIPALESAVEVGLQIIKYDAARESFDLVFDGLVETFEACRRLDRLKSSVVAANPNALLFARPAYEVYIAVRVLATYAVRRKRWHFLKGIIPRFVRAFTVDNLSQIQIPIVFWPFSSGLELPDMREGRNWTLWNERVKSAWVPYFGAAEEFLSAAAQLEFILEFNSYIFMAVKNAEIQKLREKLGNKYFAYVPDFWASRLDATVSIAEQFYEALAGPGFPPEFAVEQQGIDVIFKGKEPKERLPFLGGYLVHLQSWQAQAMMQFNRFPFMFEWHGRLGDIANAYRESRKPR
jgi:hypothetical protein